MDFQDIVNIYRKYNLNQNLVNQYFNYINTEDMKKSFIAEFKKENCRNYIFGLIALISELQTKIDKEIIISSSYRNKEKQEKLKSVPNSLHLIGGAVDITFKNLKGAELNKYLATCFIILDYYDKKNMLHSIINKYLPKNNDNFNLSIYQQPTILELGLYNNVDIVHVGINSKTKSTPDRYVK